MDCMVNANPYQQVNTNSLTRTVAFVISFCLVYLVKAHSHLILSNECNTKINLSS